MTTNNKVTLANSNELVTFKIKQENNQKVTIISNELVELINRLRISKKQITHANLLKKVPKVLKGAEVKFYSSYLDLNKQERPCYIFPKREASLMAMSYSYEVQSAVFDYMTELEEKMNTKEIPKTYSQALLEAGRLAEENEKLQTQLSNQAPLIELAETITEATNAIDFASCAKALRLPFGRNELFKFCRNQGLLMNNNSPYQEYVDRAYFIVLETSWLHPKTGDRQIGLKTLITGKGQAYILKKINQSKI